MIRGTSLAVVGLLLFAVALRGQEQRSEQSEEFKPLFDGKTLEGWEGDPTRWSVEDGAITGRTTADNPLRRNSFLIYKGGDVDNFVLRLKFRIENGNSGVQYRSQVRDAETWSVGGYQADIDATGRYMGILYEEQGRGILAERGQRVVLTRDGDELNKETESIGDARELMEGIDPTDWHDYEITAVGNRFTHKIDGRTMVEVVDRDREQREQSGVLALQIHIGAPMVVQFKDVQLRKIVFQGRGNRRGGRGGRGGGNARPADYEPAGPKLTLLPGFEAEMIYKVPAQEQGSWVSLTVDPKGRLIASDQYGKLYRITLNPTTTTSSPPPSGRERGPGNGGEGAAVHVEPLAIDIGMAQGLCCAFDSLYVMVNNQGGNRDSGFYRVRDTDGDDQYDSVELLREIEGGGEHGPHAIVPGPDGQSLYICAGNHTKLPPIEKSRVPRHWSEDHLLPRMWDARGHARGILAPGGWIIKTDPDGKVFELISNGYRNEYDIAFNAEGELFTYDADMEWDIGAPWYRPTRVNHATSGSEFGWRSGTGKWPAYYPDSLPAVVDIGPGSPTGIVFGTGAKFPEKYQRALYLCDWSYGIIYAVHLEPSGASYTGAVEQFISAAPLPATDIVIHPQDGAMYIAVGGRRAQSALYRVTYTGQEPTAPAASHDTREQRSLVALRHELERLHQPEPTESKVDPWQHLGHDDRFIRFAARIAIEHQPVDEWREQAFEQESPRALINAMVALARCGQSSDLTRAIRALAGLDWESLDKQSRLEALRAYALAFTRFGRPDDETRQVALEVLDRHFPSEDEQINRELCQVLVYLGAPNVARRILDLMAAAPTQQEQIHYAYSLRPLSEGWTLDERKEYLDWFHKAAAARGGMSFGGFLRNIRQEAIDAMDDSARAALAEVIAHVPRPVDPTVELASRQKIAEWTVEDLVPAVAEMTSGRDFERGRQMFAVAQCFKCHRVQGEGDTIGPDLTGVGRRYNARDLLTSVIKPNEVISDQYQQTTFVVNGRSITGRVVNIGGDGMSVMTNMLDQSALASINRNDLQEQFASDVSAMPAGLLDTLTKEEILDLMGYLIAGGDPNHELFQ